MVLTALLVLAAAVTIFGLVRYWPDAEKRADSVSTTEFAAPGVTFPIATVTRVLPVCPGNAGEVGATPAPGQPGEVVEEGTTCGAITVRLDEGAAAGTTLSVSVPPAITDSGLQTDDKVQLMRVPPQEGAAEAYSFLQVQRGAPLTIMAILFLVVVAVVARVRGLLALLGLVIGGFVVIAFMLPALLEGESGLVVAAVGSSAIMFVVLYLAHGLSIRTSTALAGTLFGVAITAVLGILAGDAARLSGVANDEAATLASFVQHMSPKELLTAAIIVAGLGVLNDVTITQSSAVWELRAAAPHLTRMDLFRSGMRIGRDHIASTIYTIVFAYAGAALPVLMLLFLYERPVLELLQTESLAEEIVRTLASAIGLVLAVPATTAIAALTVSGAQARLGRPQAPRPPAPTGGSRPAPTRPAPTGPGAPAPSGPPTTRAEARARRRT
ncbi:MAG TPA: YibE/F family protein [Dermatophilaceae bacterium]|nr:YibE/F family protein [Dermatophilaceae bacterium]